MSISKGLKAIREAQERRDAQAGPKTNWFKIDDGQSVRLRFLDDLDNSVATENGAGIATQLDEHQSPLDFRRKMQCTKDSAGRCWACEHAMSNPKKGWARKSRVYFNVLVNDGSNDPYVAVWSTGTRRSPLWETLVDTFVDEGSIANREWRVKRSGVETNTTYTMRSLQVDDDESPFGFESFEPFDLEKVVRALDYDEQEAFMLAGSTEKQDDDTSEDWV